MNLPGRRMARTTAAAWVATLCAGCAALGPHGHEMQQIDAIVAQSVAAAHAPETERRAELARAQRAYQERPEEADRLKLAALLATLPAPLRDDARAAALLEPLAAKSPPTPFARFAALLSAQIAERQRAARAGERREERLRNQIEALKSIEREVIEREERLRARQR
jgi:hypothetical protein